MWRDYGFGAFKVGLAAGASQDEREQRSRVMLARALDTGSLVAMVGSGVSRNLGYPSWEEFAEGVVDTTLGALDEKQPAHERYGRRLRRFKMYLAEERTKADRLTFFIGVCKEAFETLDLSMDQYHAYFERTFGRWQATLSGRSNPFEELLRLPIRRFVTTNYDCEIEKALQRKYHLPWQV